MRCSGLDLGLRVLYRAEAQVIQRCAIKLQFDQLSSLCDPLVTHTKVKLDRIPSLSFSVSGRLSLELGVGGAAGPEPLGI